MPTSGRERLYLVARKHARPPKLAGEDPKQLFDNCRQFIDLVRAFAHNLARFPERHAELSTKMTRDDDVRTSPRGSPAPDFGFAVDPAAEQITRGIEQDIFRGRLRPGEKLREEELAERFDASRHHVREALTRLAQTGIVMKERNRGAFVRRFSADEVRQIYEIREIMQRQAALKIALPATPDTVRGLSSINDAYEDAVRSGDFHRIHETNDRFHTELFSLCGNHLLVSLISNYMDLTYAIRGAAFADPENLDKSREHHRIMLRLLSGADSWALAQICVDHIQITKELYLSILRESGDEHTPQLGVER